MFGPWFVIQYFMSVNFCNHLDGEYKDDCFALIVFLLSCGSQCSVALPHGALGWFVVCDCAISCLYSLAFFIAIKVRY